MSNGELEKININRKKQLPVFNQLEKRTAEHHCNIVDGILIRVSGIKHSKIIQVKRLNIQIIPDHPWDQICRPRKNIPWHHPHNVWSGYVMSKPGNMSKFFNLASSSHVMSSCAARPSQPRRRRQTTEVRNNWLGLFRSRASELWACAVLIRMLRQDVFLQNAK